MIRSSSSRHALGAKSAAGGTENAIAACRLAKAIDSASAQDWRQRLAEVREMLAAAKAGDLAPAQSYLTSVVGPWFLNHRNTMDWVTAQFLKGVAGGGCSAC